MNSIITCKLIVLYYAMEQNGSQCYLIVLQSMFVNVNVVNVGSLVQ
jgi:hypothetical protein